MIILQSLKKPHINKELKRMISIMGYCCFYVQRSLNNLDDLTGRSSRREGGARTVIHTSTRCDVHLSSHDVRIQLTIRSEDVLGKEFMAMNIL
jgi:hypothetical protein